MTKTMSKIPHWLLAGALALGATLAHAADVALLTSFGPSRLDRFTIWTDEVGEEALL